MNASTNNLPLTLRTTNSGFTLIELMVTIAVLAIIVGIAAPSISTQLANQRVKSTTATLVNALKEAKVESIIRRQEITLSYANDSTKGGTITIEDNDSNPLITYHYDAKTTIKSTDDEIKFQPNKTVTEMQLTVCDNANSVSPQQILISAIGVITSKTGGTCE